MQLKRTQFRVETCWANIVLKNLIASVIGGCVCKKKKLFHLQNLSSDCLHRATAQKSFYLTNLHTLVESRVSYLGRKLHSQVEVVLFALMSWFTAGYDTRYLPMYVCMCPNSWLCSCKFWSCWIGPKLTFSMVTPAICSQSFLHNSISTSFYVCNTLHFVRSM
jgi:hypothetical protein